MANRARVLTKVRLYLYDAETNELIEAVDCRTAASAVSTLLGTDVETYLGIVQEHMDNADIHMSLAEKEEFQANSTYIDEVPTVNAFGGIEAGWTTSPEGMPITDVVRKLLHPWIAPVVSVSMRPTNGGYVEAGTTVSITGFNVSVTVKSALIKKLEVLNGTTVVASKEDNSIATGTYVLNYAETFGSNRQFTLNVTDGDGKVTTAKTGTYTFVNPYYYGAMDSSTEITDVSVTALTKLINPKGNRAYRFTTNNACCVLAYQKSYGTISKITDQNGYDITATFTRSEITIKNIAYYVYRNSPSTVTNFSITFTY